MPSKIHARLINLFGFFSVLVLFYCIFLSVSDFLKASYVPSPTPMHVFFEEKRSGNS